MLHAVQQMFGAHSSWILLHESASNQLVTAAFRGRGADSYAGVRIPAERGIAGLAFTRREPVFVREGGSIGAVVDMEKVLKSPVMFLGLSLPEHGYHAPNENYDWPQASGGMAAFVKYFDNLARM